MFRFFFFVVLLFSTASFAATPEGLQKTLQKQFAEMKQQAGGRLTTEGDLQITDNKIIYPAMKVMVADMKSSWSVPSVVLTFTGNAKDGKIPFTLTLPDHFQQTHVNGQALRNVALSGQTITGQWSEKESMIESLTGKIASVTWNDLSSQATTTAKDITLQTLTKFNQTDKVNVLLQAKTKQFTHIPDGFISGLLPQQSSLTGQIKSLPKALVIFGALTPIPGLQSTLAQMGTQLDIDNVNIVTANGATLDGKGWFKAAKEGSALPVSGRMDLEWQNLQQVLTSLQQGFSSGTGNRASTAQSMVLLMMLQGMGKTVDKTTRYTVDLTPEGQVILNGQDVTALFVGDKSLLKFFQPKTAKGFTPPAIPNQPVKDEGAI